MVERINGFDLLGDFRSDQAGFCRWTTAEKRGKTYFLKEFVDPVYPTSSALSPVILEDRRQICREFEDSKKTLYQAVNEVSDGNLVRVEAFFRHGARYYIAMPRIIDAGITMETVRESPMSMRLQLCRTLAYSLSRLHERGIVHADLKPGNILLKGTRTGRFAAKIVDYDCSFFENDPPVDSEDLHGDQVYLSPEALRFFLGDPVRLTCAMDVFALGILFHEYLTGSLPYFDRSEFDYPCEALLEGGELRCSPSLDDPGRPGDMIRAMLRAEPSERISMGEVFAILSEKKYSAGEGRTAASGIPERRKDPEAGPFRPANARDLL